jgi:hypothetical protein
MKSASAIETFTTDADHRIIDANTTCRQRSAP